MLLNNAIKKKKKRKKSCYNCVLLIACPAPGTLFTVPGCFKHRLRISCY